MAAATSFKPLITDLTREELVAWCAERGGGYRADQIRKWIFGKRVNDFDAMHDIPAALRAALAEQFDFFGSKIVRHQVANDRTEKLLLQLRDGETVECVVMREEDRQTVCISTQVGCAMGCVFCASGLEGVKRNLSCGEILDQVLRLDRLLPLTERITNVVVMGMGEPLANLRALLPALRTLNDKGGMGMGARRITVSTVGLPEKMLELAKTDLPFHLAVSLHAPNDELRTQIVPVNKNIGIAEILSAADQYFEITGRRITYEYVLLAGVNDHDDHALQLARLLRGRNAHINLIPMNSVSTIALHAPGSPRSRQFVDLLRDNGVNVTIRKRKGADIDAACGQLRLSNQEAAAPVLQQLQVTESN
ncbi:23S rRNA (adenine(2503)-C(2))-methyltransferase RlmN [Planctomicrobium piriforme]|uniref:Probable dual-specificity RNA methyltransferase RlmN n=1 Tax=Planctomicrobium piriforme TaxID=1576369 RepID=A0A1I3D9F0_9PLAN|nr:23S rRNA (adenine(2503)-C(2))-methyltransferase RlmN [Planctomicrobium piriforme]SFH83372.1 23S rRNA (adenine2503-C2)-methyltransferase [Planctomicrobium piriforme]